MPPMLNRICLRNISLALAVSLPAIQVLAQKVSISNVTALEGQKRQFALTPDPKVEGKFTDDAPKSATFSETSENVIITMPTKNYQVSKSTEIFFVTPETRQRAYVPTTGMATVVDKPRITIHDATATEGEDLSFKLKLDQQVEAPFTVELEFRDGTATSNTNNAKRRKDVGDYDASAVFVVFEGKQNEEHTVKVKTLVDYSPGEGMESFTVALATDSPQGIDLSSTARGFISDFSDCVNCPSTLFLDTVKQLDLTFFGDGNLQKTVQSEDEIAATTGIGVHVNKYFKNRPEQKFGAWYRAELMAQINIASTVDTITATVVERNGTRVIDNLSSFGNSALTPLNSGQAVDLKLRLYNKKTIWGVISGFEFRYVGSNRVWQITDDSLNLDLAEQVNTNLARIIAFHDFIPYHLRDSYSVMLRLGYAANWIRGDLGARDREKIRQQFVGTNRRTFHGLELGMGFRLRNILADFAYTILPSSTNVPGLTGSRLVMTIKFVGGFKISLDQA